MTTGGGILIYPKLINSPRGIQTLDTWLRSFGPALPSGFLWSHQLVDNVLMGQNITWLRLANTWYIPTFQFLAHEKMTKLSCYYFLNSSKSSKGTVKQQMKWGLRQIKNKLCPYFEALQIKWNLGLAMWHALANGTFKHDTSRSLKSIYVRGHQSCLLDAGSMRPSCPANHLTNGLSGTNQSPANLPPHFSYMRTQISRTAQISTTQRAKPQN